MYSAVRSPEYADRSHARQQPRSVPLAHQTRTVAESRLARCTAMSATASSVSCSARGDAELLPADWTTGRRCVTLWRITIEQTSHVRNTYRSRPCRRHRPRHDQGGGLRHLRYSDGLALGRERDAAPFIARQEEFALAWASASAEHGGPSGRAAAPLYVHRRAAPAEPYIAPR
jgi:hypothetical protein